MKKTNLVFLILAIVFITAAFILVSCAYSANYQTQTIDSGLGFVLTSSSYQSNHYADLLNLLGRMSFTLGLILIVSFAIMSISSTKNYYYEIEDEDYCFDDDCCCEVDECGCVVDHCGCDEDHKE